MAEPIAPAAVDRAALSTVDQFWRFAVIGTIGFVVDASVLTFAVTMLHLGPYAGRLLSFLAAATCTWALNRRFTFHNAGNQSAFVQWARFLGANGIGFCVNYATYVAVVNLAPLHNAGGFEPLFGASVPKADLILGVAAGSITGLVFNFTINKFWVFRHRL